LLQDVPFRVVGVFTLYETEQQRKRREAGLLDRTRERQERFATKPNRWNPVEQKNNIVIIPFRTYQQTFRSSKMVDGKEQGPNIIIDRLTTQINDISRFDEALDQLRNILTRTRRGVQDFALDTREDWIERRNESLRATRISGGFIAGISLVVGGIGIANIMLASISERVREIGIRRALGARGSDIFIQILVEGLVLAGLGAALGLVASLGLMRLLETLSPTENSPVIELSSILISVAFALLIGCLAGLYPAWKASRLHPIQALRYD